ncbi:hypothetical protein RHRU231_680039 [Rhodococcus ruber]|uniref:Uncharacterized protein n=1 Tax=Rhodococcus ruber TaxID=1830 RepID=A0A098BPW3_9NOCA|nr:hypothetical protein RHRU231_680039 [Rhodococcus ruber]
MIGWDVLPERIDHRGLRRVQAGREQTPRHSDGHLAGTVLQGAGSRTLIGGAAPSRVRPGPEDMRRFTKNHSALLPRRGYPPRPGGRPRRTRGPEFG